MTQHELVVSTCRRLCGFDRCVRCTVQHIFNTRAPVSFGLRNRPPLKFTDLGVSIDEFLNVVRTLECGGELDRLEERMGVCRQALIRTVQSRAWGAAAEVMGFGTGRALPRWRTIIYSTADRGEVLAAVTSLASLLESDSLALELIHWLFEQFVLDTPRGISAERLRDHLRAGVKDTLADEPGWIVQEIRDCLRALRTTASRSDQLRGGRWSWEVVSAFLSVMPNLDDCMAQGFVRTRVKELAKNMD